MRKNKLNTQYRHQRSNKTFFFFFLSRLCSQFKKMCEYIFTLLDYNIPWQPAHRKESGTTVYKALLLLTELIKMEICS